MSQSFMWPLFVVLLQPLFSLLTHFLQALKHEHVEHRFPVAAIESLDEAVLHRFAWFDELQSHTMVFSPLSHSYRDELGTIIQSQLERIAADSGYLVKLAHDPRGRQVEVDDDRQRFAIKVIDDIEGAEARSIPQRITHKVR